jgi:hypothetical protein
MERIPVESAIVDAVRAFKTRRPRLSRTDHVEVLAGTH